MDISRHCGSDCCYGEVGRQNSYRTRSRTRTSIPSSKLMIISSLSMLIIMMTGLKSNTENGLSVLAFTVIPFPSQSPAKASMATAYGTTMKKGKYTSMSAVLKSTRTLAMTIALASNERRITRLLATELLTSEKEAEVMDSGQASKTLSKISTSNAKESRRLVAQETWKIISTTDIPESYSEQIPFHDKSSVKIYNQLLFDEFTKLKGTYFINGLSSCRIGNKIIHPFEVHGTIKSIALDGTGQFLQIKSAIIQTPLTQWERRLQIPLARGVMSSLGSNPISNAVTSSERNTANLSATLWPPAATTALPTNTDKGQRKRPILIVASDNAMPYVIDPYSMETLGPLSSFLPGIPTNKKFLAHTRIDDKRQRLILCSTKFVLDGPNRPASTVFEFHEYDTDFQLVSKRKYRTDRFVVFHDWMITDQYYIVPKNPARFNWNQLPKFIFGLVPGTEVFEMDYNSVGEFLLIPRHNDAHDGNEPTVPVLQCKANSFFNIFHFGPCFEHTKSSSSSTTTTSNNSRFLTIYASVFDKYKFGGEMGYSSYHNDMDPISWSASTDAPAPRLDKFVIDLSAIDDNDGGISSGRIIERERIPMIAERNGATTFGADIPVDMPGFNGDGKQCRYGYFVGASRPEGWFPPRSVVKADLEAKQTWNWDAGDTSIVSEPMFLPRCSTSSSNNSNNSDNCDPANCVGDDDDDGFVISIAHNSETKICELVVWDSKTFGNGPIGIIQLGALTPWCVHGSWVPGFVATKDNEFDQ